MAPHAPPVGARCARHQQLTQHPSLVDPAARQPPGGGGVCHLCTDDHFAAAAAGMAAALSPMLLGYQIEAVWHTAVVIDGRKEVFFGYGIAQARPGSTMFGQPMRVLDMG